MPMYEFGCPNGHVVEHFFRMNDERPATIPCECGAESKRIFSLAGIVPDFPEHYNISLGRVVKGRQHLRQLQKQLGCHDWEPGKKERPQYDRLRKEGFM